ncbi:RF-1 domain-containing protein [Biscogniauxia marginata]|nr:RF-1 domain-containing protein [Biscogniauxia marginata]
MPLPKPTPAILRSAVIHTATATATAAIAKNTRRRPGLPVLLPSHQRRHFRTGTSPLLGSSKNLPPRPKPPPEDEIEESFLKGSGPGGQKINKTNSAVQLKHLPTGLVVKSQATRSRSQNRTIARQLLADKLDDLARGGQSRAAVVGEVRRKKKASAAKKSRRKYRKLTGQEDEGEREEETEDGDDDIAVEGDGGGLDKEKRNDIS